jgi:hypothetical protein
MLCDATNHLWGKQRDGEGIAALGTHFEIGSDRYEYMYPFGASHETTQVVLS